MSHYIFLIPLFPLLGFLFNFIVGVRVLTPRPKRKPAPPGGHGHGHGDAHAHAHTPEPSAAPEPADDHAHKAHSTAHDDDAHGHGAAHHPPSPIVGIVACLMVALSFLVAVLVVVNAQSAPEHMLTQKLWEWIPGGAAETAVHGHAGTSLFSINWEYQVDALSSVWVLFVTFIGFLIHVYSTGYMSHDPGYARFMSYLNLFMFSMLTLILGANYLMLFVGWEGVGLCSYLLIGFWFDKQSAADAGKKAFIVNRIGDAGFAIGMFYIFRQFGSLDFRAIAEQAAHLPVELAWTGTLTIIGLCLFWGACGKSAQLPLYVWLPDAMEGPTPVSALIHAATMVTAGVYMVARSGVIYAHAPKAMMVVAIVGAATALFAASIGLVQYDIKRVLAYSTVSQLGYMFLACGVGAFAAGAFHVFTHAFFKALLFLGSGSVIHGMSGEQDMRKMGGLKDKMPVTRLTMLIGCIAIAGIPPLAGFFSKDEILWSAYKVGGYGQTVWLIGLISAGMTAFYMFRLYFMTFSGGFRGTEEQAAHVHESPKSMTVPLMVLAAGSVVVGLLGIPHAIDFIHVGNLFEHFTEPAFAGAHHALAEVFTAPVPPVSVEYMLMLASIAIAACGIGLATYLYKVKPALSDALASGLAPVHRVLLHKYYVDELYNAVFVRLAALGGGNALWAVDRHIVDGGDGRVRPAWPLSVNGIGWLTRDIVAKLSDFWDRWVVDGLVNLTAFAFDAGSYVFRAVQNGRIQQYALVMLIGVFLLISAGHFVFALY
jgi:NADH-quinone oxidoreductase subunit L